jgi:hypothetical protein
LHKEPSHDVELPVWWRDPEQEEYRLRSFAGKRTETARKAAPKHGDPPPDSGELLLDAGKVLASALGIALAIELFFRAPT